jgi:hypothetical protein
MPLLGRWVLVAGATTVLWLVGPAYPPWAITSNGGPVTLAFAVGRLALMAVAFIWLLLLSAAAVAGTLTVMPYFRGPRALRLVAGSWLLATSPAGPALAAPGGQPPPGPAPVLIAPVPYAIPATASRGTRRARAGRGPAIPRPQSWMVRPGDNLWIIAEAVVAAHLGRSPSDQEIGPYWLSIIAVNRSRLPDPADPSLLFPGDTVVLPSPGTLLSWPAGS